MNTLTSKQKAEVIATIKRRLQSHPGDAPWSCVACYHGNFCPEQKILLAAEEYFEKLEVRRNS